MASVNVYNIKAEKVGEEKLNSAIFEVPAKSEVISQVLIAHMANSRKVLAHTKGRSEVRGGGKKPWRQKGTGRARHGSIRSPLWIGGGVTFGPTKERNFSLYINKKKKKKALYMVLSDKVTNEKLILIDKLQKKKKKKKMIEFIANFKKITNKEKDKKEKKILLVHSDKAGDLIKAGRNIDKIKTIGVNNLNIRDLLEFEYIMMEKDGLKIIDKLYSIRKGTPAKSKKE